MVPLLSHPGFRARTLPLSVEAWHWMVERGLAPARAELLRGVIVEKMPKSPLHTKLVARLWSVFAAALGDTHWIRKEEPLTLADSEPEPDIAIVPGQEADYAVHPSTALLVVEVAVTTLAEDRELAAIYAEAGVPEYWIVDSHSRSVEIYRQPEAGAYRFSERRMADAILDATSLPGVRIALSELFANLP